MFSSSTYMGAMNGLGFVAIMARGGLFSYHVRTTVSVRRDIV